MNRDRSAPGSGPNHSPYDSDEALDEAHAPSLRSRLQFVAGAVARGKRLFAAILIVGFAVLGVYYATKTPLYRVSTTLLTQRQQAMPSIVRAAVPNELPTKAAFELIQRRENLVSLLKQTNVYSPSSPAPKSDWMIRLELAAARLWSSTPPDDPLNLLVLRLKKALTVETGDGTVTISVDWPDAQQAYQLVEAALQNFLEARQLQEITAIDDTITLLQGRVSVLRQELDAAISGSIPRVAAAPASDASTRATPSRGSAPVSDGLAVLKANLDAKERALRDMEDFRRRRLLDLQAQLDEKRGVYSDAHPNMVALRNEIAGLSRESPQIAALREEEQALRAEYNERAALESRQVSSARVDRSPRQVVIAPGSETEAVREARFRYQQMVERVNAAQLDLDSARAAFKYRYSVVWPAEVPRRPVSPNPLKIFGLGGFLVLALALGAAVWRESRTGQIFTRSQIEIGLDLPVLAEFNREP
jgi:uncharacterized protein involved in exopolysaccharide biosynthesis